MKVLHRVQLGCELYDLLRKALLSGGSCAEVDGILVDLEQKCRSPAPVTGSRTDDIKSSIGKDDLKFWLEDVGRLMFEARSMKTRQLALNALEAAVYQIKATNYQEHSSWGEIREIICKEYTSLLDTARSEKDPNWHRIWSVLVRIIDRELCQGSSIINMFLSIVEAGFRSPELSIREQSFDCWRLLVEIFANNKQINIPKRVKLICIPLKSSKSKTETIAMKKFDIWWYLLCQLRPQLDAMGDTIFEPFIYFCFGPSFKTPLCYYFDSSYQELGAPGKMYQSIKQLSAIALIHLLGPVPAITKTLVTSPDSGSLQYPFDFTDTSMVISDTLFSAKAKLIVNSCTECTVLLGQMHHLDYLQINRCVWNNLIRRGTTGTTVSKNDMLQWIKEDMNALLKLCLLQESDLVLRDLLYDTLLTIVQSDLFKVNIGYDPPEQLIFNYKTLMPLLLHSQLPCPVEKSEPIVKCLFDLKRHTGQNVYWDILHKTVQYICLEDNHSGNNSSDFRAIRSQIYTQLGNYLTVQIREDMEGFLQHQTTVMSFLLYPLEYDQLLLIESVKELWISIYEPIAKQETNTCEFVNAFCEMIKAMTIAKHGYSTVVVADSLCYIMRSLKPNFEPTSSPVKVLELFKDVSRKGLAYKTNLDSIESMVGCFGELLERLGPKKVLVLIMPIRNAINELVSSEPGLQMGEVKKLLEVISNKMLLPEMSKELAGQSSDVKWNCKMLLKSLLNLSDDVKKGWKVAEMKKLMNAWDDKTGNNNKTPKRNTKEEEFVVIEKVWKFKPESLTEHQREKMMQKRTDIPALYNDMSQSQDSFVIKPWTPSKGIAPLKQNASSAVTVPNATQMETDKIVSKEPGDTVAMETEEVLSTSAKSASESKPVTSRLDKENNNGNVLNEEPALPTKQDSTETEEEKKQQSRKRKQSVLDKLRIDTVEGKSLDVMNLSRTRRSELPEKRTTRQKMNTSQEIASEKKRNTVSKANVEQTSASTSKVSTVKRTEQKEKRRSRKLLNFEKHESTDSSSGSTDKDKQANVSEDVIESSQSDSSEYANKRPSFVKFRASELAAKSNEMADTCTTPVQNEKEPSMALGETQHVDKIDNESAANSANTIGSIIEAHEKKESDTSRLPEQRESDAEPRVLQQPAAVSNEESTNAQQPAQVPPKNPNILLSPSRRVLRVSLDEASNKGLLSQLTILSPRKMADSKLVPKCLYSPSKSMLKAEKKDKESPSTKTACDEAMREALKLVGAGNRDTKTLPLPLVVVEPITNIANTLRDDAEHQTEAISHPIISLKMDSKEHDENHASGNNAPQPTTSNTASLVEPSTSVAELVENNSKQLPIEPMPTSEQTTLEPAALSMDQLSPVKNLDEEMEPLNKSLNRSIISSPNRAGEEERNADLLNSTLNISPISEEKGAIPKNVDSGELAGSADCRRSSNRIVGRERDMMSNAANATPVQTIVSRRSKASPTPQTPSGSNSALKARTHLQSSSMLHSPRSNMIGHGGRGAQLINLIRNQQSDQSPKPNTPPQNASTPKVGQGSASRLMMRKKAIVGSATAASASEGTACAETMKHGEENGQDKGTQYLFFSKALPSPLASPAGSILKRKHNQDESGGDDIESPINKRKRVSFHDPPVSLTKEYIRQVEECRPVSVSRSLQLSSSITSSADRAKFMMRRKSKSDSISELQHFTTNQANSSNEGVSGVGQGSGGSKVMDEDMDEVELTSSPESLDEHEFMMHDATDNMAALQVTSGCTDISQNEHSNSGTRECVTALEPEQQVTTAGVDEKTHGSPNQIRFASEDALLEHVLSRYTLDDMCERYIAAGKTLEKPKSVRSLTKELSAKMSDDPKMRDAVLDELSERHSVEFLDHAIQENSNAKVCERLSAITMMDHVFKRLHAAYNTQHVDQAAQGTQTEKEEADRVMETIFENLLSLPGTDSQKLAELREQFLQKELARKDRLEIMTLLETYFKASSHHQTT
ncbi:telomere-associated protein RIF1 [Anopheles maculipalpis]|uniref:telomere-associated protein RIF1 n=1 Tax=Anopheles maculipalpis TaxID=1496333 RepID=UPI002159131D|nr:telomere-associated protein RIF1 [Anopheles maculipalpis]